MYAVSFPNLDAFNAELHEFSKTLSDKDFVDFHRLVTLDALSRIVKRTRVDTGRARGGWQVSIDRPIEGNIGRLDKGGAATIAEGTLALTKLAPFAVTYLSNNVEYIIWLEEGTETRAGDHMIETTFAELRQIFDKEQ